MNKEKYYKEISEFSYDLSFLKNKSILITGPTGLIGSYLIDVLMNKNIEEKLNCSIFAISRNRDTFEKKFGKYKDHKNLIMLNQDINKEIESKEKKINYAIHLASNTNPYLYSTKPIETIKTNILGTANVLDAAKKLNIKKVIFISSVEVYGEKTNRTKRFKEDEYGQLDCNKLRSGYPESKRCGEALCQAYIKEKRINVIIARLSRVYGPSFEIKDTKSTSEFFKKAGKSENLILKTKGKQMFSFCYVSDAVAGVLCLLSNGVCGEAYNIADEKSETTISNFAELIARNSGVEVIYKEADETEKEGYSTIKSSLMNCAKIKKLGWEPKIHMNEGIVRTLAITK